MSVKREDLDDDLLEQVDQFDSQLMAFKRTLRLQAVRILPSSPKEDIIEASSDLENEFTEIEKLYRAFRKSVRNSNVIQDFESKLNDCQCRIENLNSKYSKWLEAIEKPAFLAPPTPPAISASDLVCLKLPPAEPDVFNGNVMAYQTWKVSFNSIISANIPNPVDRLAYLSKYLSGEAKQCVKNHLLGAHQNSFELAMRKLEDRYGNSFVLTQSLAEELAKSPRVGNSPHLLQKFSDTLEQVLAHVDQFKELHYLNSPQENRKLLEKLPPATINRWRRHVCEYTDTHSEYPPFKEFVKFIKSESKIANEPHLLDLTKSFNTPAPVPHKSEKGHSFSQHITDGSNHSGTVQRSADKFCVFCKTKNHYVQECLKFSKASLSEREATVLKFRLCRSCMRSGHIAKSCRNPVSCSICQGLHPSVLHDSIERFRNSRVRGEASPYVGGHTQKKEISSATTQVPKALSQFAPTLPVWVSSVNNPNYEVLVYAALDSQSDSSFVTSRLASKLNVSQQPVELHLSTMTAKSKLVSSSKVNGLVIRGHNENHSCSINLPTCYTRQAIPVTRSHIATPENTRSFQHLQFLQNELLSENPNVEVELLIGYDCGRALVPRNVVLAPGKNGDEPYAIKFDLGWSVQGSSPCVSSLATVSATCHKVIAYESGHRSNFLCFRTQTSIEDALNVLERDQIVTYENSVDDEILESQNDRKFIEIVSSGIKKVESNNYQIPLPFNEKIDNLSNNYESALKRLEMLKARLKKRPELYEQYSAFMQELESEKYSFPVTDVNNIKWVLPHHCVFNKSKIRVVFDCAAKNDGLSLNDCLYQGPDLNNSLFDVLVKFRVFPYALVADIKKMYYNFLVPQEHSFYMCYLWFPEGNLDLQPVVRAMKVHSFGLKSAPSCCIYGFRQLAKDTHSQFGDLVYKFLSQDFYVDDGTTSVSSPQVAIELAKSSIEACETANITLHKFASNYTPVLSEIPQSHRAANFDHKFIEFDEFEVQKTLGLSWSIKKDCFIYTFNNQRLQAPYTKRGVLSVVSSLFDPLGFLSAFTLVGKLILQQCCKVGGVDWDASLPVEMSEKYSEWLRSFQHIDSFEIPRCLTVALDLLAGDSLETPISVQLHVFVDASFSAYGAVIYLVCEWSQFEPTSQLVLSKSRVAPSKQHTIPRLELMAACLGVKLAKSVKKVLLTTSLSTSPSSVSVKYYSDSMIVLGYINNMSKRFHVFVTNRLTYIHQHSSPEEWLYVPTHSNPADVVSRGCLLTDLAKVWKCWLKAPEFVIKKQKFPISQSDINSVLEGNSEIKANSFAVKIAPSQTEIVDPFDFSRVSSWRRLTRVVAFVLLFIQNLKTKTRSSDLTIGLLLEAKFLICSLVQATFYKVDIERLSKGHNVLKKSKLYKLDCFIDVTHRLPLIRVGGRLCRSSYSDNEKHPLVLPKLSHVSKLVVSHCHELCCHQGRSFTLGRIRSEGYWIVGVRRLVTNLLYKCVTCRRLRALPKPQKMADLPVDRVTESPPFTFVGCDLFGPFLIKERRSEVKRWACIFSCLVSRAIHIETVSSLSADSFIQALRRFLSLRGPISLMRSDRGTNFIGANRELHDSLEQVVSQEVKDFLVKNSCVFEWRFNPPGASNFGGSWERMIGIVRSVLSTLLSQVGTQLSHESLVTLFHEASAIVNQRPLVLDTVTDSSVIQILTPFHLLTQKSHVVLTPPSVFQREDLYIVSQWRRVQYSLQLFWDKFRKQYVDYLQSRQKWQRTGPKFKENDIVLVIDKTAPRSCWKYGKILSLYPSKDGISRSASVQIGQTAFDRPLNQLVLLLENPKND